MNSGRSMSHSPSPSCAFHTPSPSSAPHSPSPSSAPHISGLRSASSALIEQEYLNELLMERQKLGPSMPVMRQCYQLLSQESMATMDETRLSSKIGRIFDEVKDSDSHLEKVLELSCLRSSSSGDFLFAFCKALTPVFGFDGHTNSSERVVRFIATFAGATDHKDFLELFLRLLLIASTSDTSARYLACQIISEVILQLPDDVEVGYELWDEVIGVMKNQIQDKAPTLRNFAVRALSRFVNDSDNIDIQDLLLEALASETHFVVRKTLVRALPPSDATSAAIIDCTLDVSESVRETAYIILADKFPVQSLSIKHRVAILERGLSDGSPVVSKEFMKLVKDEWLIKCCNSDPVELLKLLDVQTYEAAGVSVIQALLRARVIKIHEDSRILDLKAGFTSHESIGTRTLILQPEIALYWRVVCSYLHCASTTYLCVGNAQAKDGATTGEGEYTSAKLLQKVLPTTVAAYVEAVNAYIAAGPDYRFSARQLLLIGVMLEYDAANKRVASILVHELLHKGLVCEEDDSGSSGKKVVMGDGINLGGNKDWASAIYVLTTRVHGGAGECEVVILRVIKQLAQPCIERETSADFMQWLHCLAITSLLLENVKSLGQLQGNAIEPEEILYSVLLPGARHLNHYVQRAAVRCLGIYGSLEREPNEDLVKQLRSSFVNDPSPISGLAGKALIDGVIWRGKDFLDADNDKGVRMRRMPRRWSQEEEDNLREAVSRWGKGNWKLILDTYAPVFGNRTAVDLKDKWRNMTK